MAVLEKIRKKSVLLFIIIIGALLAFILGDFLNSGRSLFGPGDTVAKVNGVKVDYQSFQAKSKEISEQMKLREANLPDEQKGQYDDDQIGSMALDQVLLEKLLQAEFDKMGIKVSDDMLSQVMLDPDFAGLVFQAMNLDQQTMMVLGQLGITDQRSFIEAFDAKTRSRYPNVTPEMAEQLHQMWLEAEKNVENQLKSYTYMSILGGLFQPNNADALAYYADANDRASVRAVSVPTASIADEDVELTDADYKEYYDAHEGAFKIKDETRAIAYITQDITPSDADRSNAVAKVRDLKAALTTNPGMEGTKKFTSQGFVSNTGIFTDKTLRSNIGLAQIPDSALVAGYVTELAVNNPDRYSVAKVLNVSEGIDKVRYTIIPAKSVEALDSIIPDKSLTAIDSVMTILTRGQAVQELSLLNPVDVSEVLVKALKEGPVESFFTVNDTINGQAGVYGLVIKERDDLAPTYEIGLVNYQLVPSTKTAQDLTAKLNAFVAKNGKAADFIANAAKEGYTVGYSTIDQNSFTIGNGNTPRTKTLVKWAMDADKGAVSPVLTVNAVGAIQPNDYLIAVAVEDIYDDDFVPVNSTVVKKSIEPMVREAKKAKMLVERYKGKASDINGYANAMGLGESDIVSNDVVFSAQMFGGEAQGAVAGAKEGTLVGPVAGNGMVYVVQVDKVTKADTDKADLKNLKKELRQSPRPSYLPAISEQNILNALIGDKSVKNNLLIFTEDITK